MIIFKTPYREVEYIATHGLILNHWTEECANLTDELLKKDFEGYVEKVITLYKPELIYHNVSKAYYPMNPDLQNWINTNVNAKAIAYGARKFAFVLPEDIFTQISIQQTVEEDVVKNKVAIAYFDEEPKAIQWLKQ